MLKQVSQDQVFDTYSKSNGRLEASNVELMRCHVQRRFQYRLGEVVVTSRRKVPPLNIEGGTARIANAHWVGGRALYDVEYIDSSRKEYRLESAVLTRKTDDERPKRCARSAAAGDAILEFAF